MNKTQAIVFFGIVVVGLAVSLFTLNKCGKKVEVAPVPTTKDPVAQVDPGKGKSPKAKGTTTTPEAGKGTPPVTPDPPVPTSFASADALLSALSDSVKNRKADQFLEIAGPDSATPLVQAQVTKLIEDPAFSLDETRPNAQIAKVAGSFSRWAIRLKKSDAPNVPKNAPEIAEIYTDIVEKPDVGFKISKVALPIDVAGYIGNPPPIASTTMKVNPAAPGTTPKATNPKGKGKGVANPGQTAPQDVGAADALTVAHAFSKAVVGRDFETARKLVDQGSISVERLAALLIAVEEGKFGLKRDNPLVETLNRENEVWVLTRLKAQDSGAGLESEFFTEIKKTDGWKVDGISFDKLLTALASQAGAGGAAYAPMVKNPQGGESLVIYFDFDNSAVSSRSIRQLEIVANILKGEPSRKLRINGHADALGTDDYNEALSNKRSAAVRNALLSLGVPQGQVITEAYGETQPLKPNFKNDGTDDPNGRSQNRRAEVYLDF